jgi:hypothetical protein
LDVGRQFWSLFAQLLLLLLCTVLFFLSLATSGVDALAALLLEPNSLSFWLLLLRRLSLRVFF